MAATTAIPFYPPTIETKELARFDISDLVFFDFDLTSTPPEFAFVQTVKGRIMYRRYYDCTGVDWKRIVEATALKFYKGKTFVIGEGKGLQLSNHLKPLFRLTDAVFHMLRPEGRDHRCRFHSGIHVFKCPSYTANLMLDKYIYIKTRGEDAWDHDSNYDYMFL